MYKYVCIYIHTVCVTGGNEDDKDAIMRMMEEEAVILTDILGLEDALGTMDFKVCGDAKGRHSQKSLCYVAQDSEKHEK